MILFLLILTVLESFQCSKNQYYNPEFIKLSATLNNPSETIHLGDTLKFKLTIPDVLVSNSQNVAVNNLQRAFYTFDCYKIDTITKRVTLITVNNIFTTEGSTDGYAVYVSNNAKPFTSSLNIVPPEKGIYYVAITPQSGTIKVNNAYEAGLIINFNVTDKHFVMLDYYIGNGFLAAANERDSRGYGFYGFRVN